jgi:hypothetical protein
MKDLMNSKASREWGSHLKASHEPATTQFLLLAFLRLLPSRLFSVPPFHRIDANGSSLVT